MPNHHCLISNKRWGWETKISTHLRRHLRHITTKSWPLNKIDTRLGRASDLLPTHRRNHKFRYDRLWLTSNRPCHIMNTTTTTTTTLLQPQRQLPIHRLKLRTNRHNQTYVDTSSRQRRPHSTKLSSHSDEGQPPAQSNNFTATSCNQPNASNLCNRKGWERDQTNITQKYYYDYEH